MSTFEPQRAHVSPGLDADELLLTRAECAGSQPCVVLPLTPSPATLERMAKAIRNLRMAPWVGANSEDLACAAYAAIVGAT